MEESAVSESGVAHYPPGASAPTAADRAAAHLARMNAAKANFYAKPLEERRKIIADRKAEKARKAQEREAQRVAKRGGTQAPDSAPPTVRSQRSSLQAAPPDSEIPRPGVRGAPLRGLLDICEAMPNLGSGTCFVQVTRVKPPVAFGVPCAGTQKPLWAPIDDAEFAAFYGGAEYTLRGYKLKDDGRAQALTESVTYKVAGPPNLDSALTEEDAMRPQPAHAPNGNGGGIPRLGRPGVVTPHVATAEAEMFARRLQHKETMDERNARRAEERRRRDEEREAARTESQTDAIRVLAERTDREVSREREMYEQRLAEKGGNMAEVAQLVKALQPQHRGEDTQALMRQHTEQIQQLTESAKQEVLRLTEQHRDEVRRLTESHAAAIQRVEDQARSDRDRADKLVRETEHRANEQIREAERRADGRVTDAQNAARATYDDLRTRSEERLRDQNQQWQQRFDDLKENHAREIRQKDSELQLMRSNLEGNQQVILAGKDTEISRLKTEVREAKAEAEKNKDFVGKLGEFERQAEALGFSKGEGVEGAESDDLKTTAIKAGLGVLQQLPQIIQSGADAISKVRNPGTPTDFPGRVAGPAARGHTRGLPRGQGAPPMLAPLPFATEDGGYVPPPDAQPLVARQAPPPQYQPVAPLEPSPILAIVPAEQQLPLPLPDPAPPQHAPNPAAPPQQQMSPAPTASVAPPPQSMAPPPAADADLDPFTLQVIQGLTPDFSAAFLQRVQPKDVVQRLIDANSVENVRGALALVTIDQVIGAVAQDQNPAHHVLKTRNGQKFLRAIWLEAEKMTAAQ
jgi:hypothetical protein